MMIKTPADDHSIPYLLLDTFIHEGLYFFQPVFFQRVNIFERCLLRTCDQVVAFQLTCVQACFTPTQCDVAGSRRVCFFYLKAFKTYAVQICNYYLHNLYLA